MKLKILVFISLTITTLIFAQQQNSSIYGGQGYFIFGQNNLDIATLNNALLSKGYSTFTDKLISFGAGGYGIEKNIIIGGEGFALNGETKSQGSYKLSLTGGAGFFNLGYVLLSNNKYILYPLLGIGGGGIVLQIADQNPTTVDNILSNPKRSSEITCGALLIKVSVGLDFILSSKKPNFSPGLKLGYIFAPIKSEWTDGNTTLGKEPEIGFSGFFFNFTIGFSDIYTK